MTLRAALVTSSLALTSLALPSVAQAATPSAGVEQTIRHGFFTETDLGTYFNFRTSNGFQVSNAQAYLQLGAGYDITDRISVGFQFGLGASSALCFGDTDVDTGACAVTDSAGHTVNDANGNPQTLADNFSNTFFQAQVTYTVPIIDRLSFAPRLLLGYQLLNPAPIVDSNGNAISGGFMVGADLGLEYATHQDHFIVGIDVVPRFCVGPNILSMAIFPRVKYTF